LEHLRRTGLHASRVREPFNTAGPTEMPFNGGGDSRGPRG